MRAQPVTQRIVHTDLPSGAAGAECVQHLLAVPNGDSPLGVGLSCAMRAPAPGVLTHGNHAFGSKHHALADAAGCIAKVGLAQIRGVIWNRQLIRSESVLVN